MENVVYVAPELEVLEVMVEQGFEVSGGAFGDPDFEYPEV